jgi:hypothetical protein
MILDSRSETETSMTVIDVSRETTGLNRRCDEGKEFGNSGRSVD